MKIFQIVVLLVALAFANATFSFNPGKPIDAATLASLRKAEVNTLNSYRRIHKVNPVVVHLTL